MDSSESSGSDDDSSPVSQDILKRLEQYGDSLLDEEDYQKRKKKVIKKKNSKLQTNNNSEDKISTNHKDTAESKKEKQNSAKKKVSKLKGQAKHLYKIKKDLGLFQNDTKSQNEKNYVNSITEVISIDKKEGGKGKTTEVIVFNDPAKRKMKKESSLAESPRNRKSVTVKSQTQSTEKAENIISTGGIHLRQAKHDVFKYGVEGLKKEKREQAQIALAIRLGAKPSKKQYMNYKKLMRKKQMEKEELEKARTLAKEMGCPMKSGKNKKKRGKREREDVLSGYLDGQIGSYRKGVQYISEYDTKSFKK